MKEFTKTTVNNYDGNGRLIGRTETIVESEFTDNTQIAPINIRPVIPTFIPKDGSKPSNVYRTPIDLQNAPNQYNVKPL